MAGAAAHLPEEERTLRALLRALRVCLILSREGAEKIASLDLENYREAFPEDEGLAQVAFDEDVNHAEEVLEWRAVVVADLVGQAMADYARAHSPMDDPWRAWRREPPTVPAAEFVRGLSEEEFFCARVAYRIHSDLNIHRPSSVPTDGDLEDIPGRLETEDARTWREWLDVLGPPQEAACLSSAAAAAKRDVTESYTGSSSEVEDRIAELADSVAAFQMPTIERLERIGAQVDALAARGKSRQECDL